MSDENVKRAVELLRASALDSMSSDAWFKVRDAIALLQPAPLSREHRIAEELDALADFWGGTTPQHKGVEIMRNIAAILREKEPK